MRTSITNKPVKGLIVLSALALTLSACGGGDFLSCSSSKGFCR